MSVAWQRAPGPPDPGLVRVSVGGSVRTATRQPTPPQCHSGFRTCPVSPCLMHQQDRNPTSDWSRHPLPWVTVLQGPPVSRCQTKPPPLRFGYLQHTCSGRLTPESYTDRHRTLTPRHTHHPCTPACPALMHSVSCGREADEQSGQGPAQGLQSDLAANSVPQWASCSPSPRPSAGPNCSCGASHGASHGGQRAG